MKIIDKTPLQDKKGIISFTARIRGTLKYGLNWYSELEAQKGVIAKLGRVLEKGYVLIRNFTLPNSEIVIPLILIGGGGIYVIYVTNVKGFFEAKGDQWNTISSGRSQPARINYLSRVAKLTRAFQKYLEIHNFKLTIPVESVLIASNPGAQIESLRPVARVVRSDAIRQFADSLLQTPISPSSGRVYDLADHIIDPSLRKEANPAEDYPEDPVSRAQAIFNASNSSKSINPNELGLEFEEDDAPFFQQADPLNYHATGSAQPFQAQTSIPAKKRILGMTIAQVAVLAGMLGIELCILIGFGALIYSNQ